MKDTFDIFFITPYSDEYFKIEQAVHEAFEKLITLLPDVNFRMRTARSVDEGSRLTEKIIEYIKDADLIICNISRYNSNAMYELGLAHAFNKATVILVDNETSIGFDIASMRYITYDQSSLSTSFVPHLAKTLTIIVAEPDEWKLYSKKTDEQIDKKKTVFVSYSHKDFIYLDRVRIHLKPLERKGLIDLWSDTLILSGEKWKEKIATALDKAAIALLLISADFMASDFIVDKELQPLLKSAESKGTIIIPVIVKPCRFLREPSISQFQSANDPINPLCKLSEYEQEDIYEKVSHRIELALGSE